MNLTLTRKSFTPEGIFGTLQDESGKVIAVTLEHSYSSLPKLAAGIYKCVLGKHTLKKRSFPFDAYQVMDVPAFQGVAVTGILIHFGNYNEDSEGCILVGSYVSPDGKYICQSMKAFQSLMAIQKGAESFMLKVESA